MNIEHISVSRKQCWDECQVKYRFKYHLKVPVELPPQPYFNYGKIVHKAAEHYVMEKGERGIVEIANDVLCGRILLEYNQRAEPLDAEYKRKLPVHLKNIQQLTDRIGFDGHLEWQFRYDLDPPNQRIITGFIDRLIIRGDKYFILDYKTTKKGFWRKNNNTIQNDLQLRCYGRVVQKEFGAKAENIRAALYYVDGPDLVSTKFTEELLVSAEEELLEAYNQISSTHPDQAWGRTGDHCRRCDYRQICPFYSLT